MKKALLLALSILFLTSCSHDDQNGTDSNSNITQLVAFGMNQKIQANNTSQEILIPTKIILTLKDVEADTLVYNQKKLDLLDFNGNYLTENLSLYVGNYSIEEYFVTDKDDKVIYASPLESSELAQYVNNPLPLEFNVILDQTTQVLPEVLIVNENYTPEDFGYTSFGFSVVDITGKNTGEQANIQEKERLKKVLSSQTIESNISVSIVNTDNQPIPNASVRIGNKIRTSNQDGLVFVENTAINKEYAKATINANGYIKTIKTFTPTENGVNSISVMLIKTPSSKSFQANQGATIQSDGITLIFPKNATANQNGNLYTGTVNANITYYNPDSKTFTQTIPGTLVGLDNNDQLQALTSYGMVKVDLTDQSGNELEIFEGKQVEIQMPAKNTDPDTIPFWHLNEDSGIWVQATTATKQENKYVTSVSHFSTYNLDSKEESINFTIELKDELGTLLTNQNLILKSNSDKGNYSENIITDNKGQFKIIRAPKNGDYSLEINMGCTKTLIKELGTLNQGLNQVAISTPSSSRTITLKGSLTQCENKPYAYKAFRIDLENNETTTSIYGFTDIEGKYSSSKAICNYDYTTTYSNTITVFEGSTNLMKKSNIILNQDIITQDISTCNNSIDIITEDTIYQGDIIIITSDEYDEFAKKEYTQVTGSLTIAPNVPNSFNSTYNLNHITHIGGDFTIKNTSTTGIKELTSIGGNLNLQNIEFLVGFDNLTTIGGNLSINSNILYSLLELNNLTTIGGDLDLQGSSDRGIKDFGLQGLDNLTSIGGDFKLHMDVKNINALKKLTSINGNFDVNTSYLHDLEGLNNLNFIGGDINLRSSLWTISALKNITTIHGNLTILTNSNLSNLNGLNNVTQIKGNLDIQSTGGYDNFSTEGLNNVSSIGSLYLHNGISDLRFDNLTTIKGDLHISQCSFSSLQGLENLTSIEGDLVVKNNDEASAAINFRLGLKDFCSLQNLFQNEGLKGQYVVNNNTYNPTIENIINGNCAL